MQFLRKLTLVASIFCLGLSPALADDDDLPTPEGLVEALEAVLAMEDGEGLSANTKLMLEVILFEEVIEGLDEEELAAAEEELQQFFEDLIADPEMPQDIRDFLKEKLDDDDDDSDDLPTPEGLVEALEAVLSMKDDEGLAANTKLLLDVILLEDAIDNLDEEAYTVAETELHEFFEGMIADPEMPQEIRDFLKAKLSEEDDDDDDD